MMTNFSWRKVLLHRQSFSPPGLSFLRCCGVAHCCAQKPLRFSSSSLRLTHGVQSTSAVQPVREREGGTLEQTQTWVRLAAACSNAAALRRQHIPDANVSAVVRTDVHIARELERVAHGWGTARFTGADRLTFLADIEAWLRCTALFLGWSTTSLHGLLPGLSQHCMVLALARVQPSAVPLDADLENLLPSPPDTLNRKQWLGVRRILDPCIASVVAALGRHADSQFHWRVAHGDRHDELLHQPTGSGADISSSIEHTHARPFCGIASLFPVVHCVAALPLASGAGSTLSDGQRGAALRALGQILAPAVRLWGRVDAPRSLAAADAPAAAARFATAFDLLWALGGGRGQLSWSHPGVTAAVQRVDGALAAAVSEGALEHIAERFGLDAPPAIASVILSVHRRHGIRAPALAWALLPALRTEAHSLLAAVSLHGEVADGSFSESKPAHADVAAEDDAAASAAPDESASVLHVGYLLARAEQLATACSSLRQMDTVDGPIALAALRCASLLHRTITRAAARSSSNSSSSGQDIEGPASVSDAGAVVDVGVSSANGHTVPQQQQSLQPGAELLDHAARALGKAVIEVVHTGALRSRRAAPLLLNDVGVWLRECGAAADAHLASCAAELEDAATQRAGDAPGTALLRLLSLPVAARTLFRLSGIVCAGPFLASGRHDAPAVVAAATARARSRLFAAIRHACRGIADIAAETGVRPEAAAGAGAGGVANAGSGIEPDTRAVTAARLFATLDAGNERLNVVIGGDRIARLERNQRERLARVERERTGAPAPEWESSAVISALQHLHNIYLFGVAAKLLSPQPASQAETTATTASEGAASAATPLPPAAATSASIRSLFAGDFFPAWLARLVLEARAELSGAETGAIAAVRAAASATDAADEQPRIGSGSVDPSRLRIMTPLAQAVAEYVQGACAARGLPQPRTLVWLPELGVHVPVAWPSQRVAIVCHGPGQCERPPVEAAAAADAVAAAVARGLFPSLRAAQQAREAELNEAPLPVHMPGVFDLRSIEAAEARRLDASKKQAAAFAEPASAEAASAIVWDRDSPHRSIVLNAIGSRLPLDHLRGHELGPPRPRPEKVHHPDESFLERFHIIARRPRAPAPPSMPAPVSPLVGSAWDGPLLPGRSLAVAALRASGWHVLSVSANSLWWVRPRGHAGAHDEGTTDALGRPVPTGGGVSGTGLAGVAGGHVDAQASADQASGMAMGPAVSSWEWDPPDALRVIERAVREQGLWDILTLTASQAQTQHGSHTAALGGAGSTGRATGAAASLAVSGVPAADSPSSPSVGVPVDSKLVSAAPSAAAAGPAPLAHAAAVESAAAAASGLVQPHPWAAVRLSSVPGIPRPDAPRPPPLRSTYRRRHFSTCAVTSSRAPVAGPSSRSAGGARGEAGRGASSQRGDNVGAVVDLAGDARAFGRSTASASASGSVARGLVDAAPAAPSERSGAAACSGAGMASGERIAKLLARAGVCSRRDAERMLAEGRVSLAGSTLTDPATRLTEAQLADVWVDGKPVPQRQHTRLWLYNKPIGLVTSHADELGRTTVFDDLRQRRPDLPRVLSVGRLDLNSEGLLLLTNDGALARALELPSSGISRVYRVLLQHGRAPPPSAAALSALASGVTVDSIVYRGIEASVERAGRRPGTSWLRMTLAEGKNREIRRVAEGALNCTVLRLQRVSYGPFRLHPDLPPGDALEVPHGVVETTLGSLLRATKAKSEAAGEQSPLR